MWQTPQLLWHLSVLGGEKKKKKLLVLKETQTDARGTDTVFKWLDRAPRSCDGCARHTGNETVLIEEKGHNWQLPREQWHPELLSLSLVTFSLSKLQFWLLKRESKFRPSGFNILTVQRARTRKSLTHAYSRAYTKNDFECEWTIYSIYIFHRKSEHINR